MMKERKIEKVCRKKGLRKNMRREVLLRVLFCCVMLCGCQADTRENLSWKFDIKEDYSQQLSSEEQEQRESTETIVAQEIQNIYVYVCGAVVHPGVYELPEGSRVCEAVAMAGGMLQEADDTCINLARIVMDGEQITILTKDEVEQMRTTSMSGQGHTQRMVNINTASVAELTQLSGIGESRAMAIIAYREQKGTFQSIEQIKNVAGIKDGLFEKIKDYITVG